MIGFRGVACLLLTTLASVGLSAQQITGSIRGTVVDPSGAVVQSAAVSAQQIETGLTRTTITGRDGSYVLVSEAFNSAGSTFSSGVSITVSN